MTPEKLRLLIVEDNSLVLLALEAEAKASGLFAAVATAPDGESALDFLQRCVRGNPEEELPHVVLTDLYMPGMNGIELIIRLRANPSTANVVGSIFSTGVDPWEREAARNAGCRAFYRKPTTMAGCWQLLQSIAGLGQATPTRPGILVAA